MSVTQSSRKPPSRPTPKRSRVNEEASEIRTRRSRKGGGDYHQAPVSALRSRGIAQQPLSDLATFVSQFRLYIEDHATIYLAFFITNGCPVSREKS